MRTRNTKIPLTPEVAHAEINKAMDEINNAQERIRKAARFLIHDGNTVSQTSAHSHYAIAIREVHQHFTDIRLVMGNAWDTLRKEYDKTATKEQAS